MWTVIFITGKQTSAEAVKKKLRENDILVRVCEKKSDDLENKCYEVLVPYAESQLAQDIVIDAEIN